MEGMSIYRAQRKSQGTVESLKAILATDLGKIFAIIVIFLTIFMIIPVIYPFIRYLGASFSETLGSSIIETWEGILQVFASVGAILAIFLLFTFALSLLLLKIAFYVHRKLAPPIYRSTFQHYTRYVSIICGFLVGGWLVGWLYSLWGQIVSIPETGELTDLLVWAFSEISLYSIVAISVFLGTIYFFIFKTDLIFFLVRKARHQPLTYPMGPPPITRRHKNIMRGIAVIMVIILVFLGVMVHLSRPTVIRFEQEAGALSITGVDPECVMIMRMTVITGTIEPSELERYIYGDFPEGGIEPVPGFKQYLIPPPLLSLLLYEFTGSSPSGTGEVLFTHVLTAPQGYNIVGFSMVVFINASIQFQVETFYFPETNYECGFYSKRLVLDQISVNLEEANVTFHVSIAEEFVFSDLFNFGW